MLDNHLIFKTRGKAKKENIVYFSNYRITVLQDELFRIEQSNNKTFSDNATQSIFYRDMPINSFKNKIINDELHIITKKVELIINNSLENSRVKLLGKEVPLNNQGNLKGTYRTLDHCLGSLYLDDCFYEEKGGHEIELENGVCSTSGVAVIDDSKSLFLSKEGKIEPNLGNTDLYVFAYAHNYKEAVKALYMITGYTPLLPRYALGNWWSRYHAYSQEEYLGLMHHFKERNIPISVATIDMDWHYSIPKHMIEKFNLKDEELNDPTVTGLTSKFDPNNIWQLGWTGYTWNEDLFPNYKELFKQLKEDGLHISVNLHPANGIRFWEKDYKAMAKANNVDAKNKKCVLFNITDDTFINSYFSILHNPMEKDGVDCWWIDWQQGTASGIPGLDPLWSLNHYHYLNSVHNQKDGLILSRYAGIGSHRYPLGFSGDTTVSFKTLDYLPYFTANATNIGYTNWSHDIGGHHMGKKDDDLYIRFLQFGVFSPINRLHCTLWETLSKEPWIYEDGVGYIAENYLRFRHQLVPLLYSENYLTHFEGKALIEPVYYYYDNKLSYKHKNEYIFASNMLVLPITSPKKGHGFSEVKGYVPEGNWVDIFTNQHYKEGEYTFIRSLNNIPVLIKEGSILVLDKNVTSTLELPTTLQLNVYKGNGKYVLYENKGKYFAKTTFINKQIKKGNKLVQELTIEIDDENKIIPEKRNYHVFFKDIFSGTFCSNVNKYEYECMSCLIKPTRKSTSISLTYIPLNELDLYKKDTLKILLNSKENNFLKETFYSEKIKPSKTIKTLIKNISEFDISEIVKRRLLENIHD